MRREAGCTLQKWGAKGSTAFGPQPSCPQEPWKLNPPL